MAYSSNKPIFGEHHHTYTSLDDIMGDRDVVYAKESWVPITLERGESFVGTIDQGLRQSPHIDVVMCSTVIVRHWPFLSENPTFSINTGGWNTVLTRSRIGEFIPYGWSFYNNRNFPWLSHDRADRSWPYAHWMTAHGILGVTGQRASEPAYKQLAGKRVPLYTVGEYIDKAFITLAWWHQMHAGYLDEKNAGQPNVRRWGAQVETIIQEIQDCMDELKNADSLEELFSSAMYMNHIMHVSPGWWDSGVILKDYGRGRGLPYAIVDFISEEGPEAYFGEDLINDFLSQPWMPELPKYMTREEYNEHKKLRKIGRVA